MHNISSIFAAGNPAGASVAPKSTQFQTFACIAPEFSSVQSEREIEMPVPVRLSNFRIRTITPQPSDSSMTVILRVNGVESGLAHNIPNDHPPGSYYTTETYVEVAAGDRIAFSGQNDSKLPSAAIQQWSITAEPIPDE